MTDKQKLAVSYHTFFFPFLWDDTGRVTRKQFAECRNPHWKEDIFASDGHTDPMDYNQYHYFNAAARNAIYTMERDDDKQIVWNYRYGTEKDSYYIIECGEFRYALYINSIRLRLYHTGIGMLVFELENHDPNTTPEDVCRINDYGRRIFAPCLEIKTDKETKEKSVSSPITADRIYITGCGDKGGNVPTIASCGYQRADVTEIVPSVMQLLTNEEKHVRAVTRRSEDTEENGEREFFIEPIIDDRMFLACFYDNKAYVDALSAWEDGEYAVFHDAVVKTPDDKTNRAQKWYTMLFADGNGSLCQSRDMLHTMLSAHTYTRWLENTKDGKRCGTITGITEYSMVSVSSEVSKAEHVAVAFLTEYVEMMMLALAQRASLLAFERRISDAAMGKLDIKKVQEQYTIFQSQLLLQEITPQQQGIELYDMLRENLYILKEEADIEKQISNLFALRNDSADRNQNFILAILACLGIFETAQVVFSWLTAVYALSDLWQLLITVGFAALPIAWFCIQRKK
ncbi:MAG: hypothetical protein ACI4V3_00790 [Faecousia sp.]